MVLLGSYDPTHPIMAGVTNVCDLYRITGTYLTPGSSAIADWADGLHFIAAKDDRTVVTINGYVGSNHQWSGQMPDVVHNTILWLLDVPWLTESPTSGTLPVAGSCTGGIVVTSVRLVITWDVSHTKPGAGSGMIPGIPGWELSGRLEVRSNGRITVVALKSARQSC